MPNQSQGVQLARMHDLARYWGSGYDLNRLEARVNAQPQYVTEIDGLDIHFLHVRSRHENALPLIITHGWPGSILELLNVIAPLTNPTAHGGRAEDAFHLVIPSLPGYGFSGKPTGPGWGPDRIARAWATLMKRLGYDQYVAQGGDWGSAVTDMLARHRAEGLLGIHVNLPSVLPADVAKVLHDGDPAPTGLSDEERAAFDGLNTFFQLGTGYSAIMVTRPETVGFALADSPTGLAAWMYDKIAAWTYSGGIPERSLTLDEILDEITLYWLTNTASSSAQLYWENKASTFIAANVSVPAAITVFPGEIYQAPRSWAEQSYHNLYYYSRVDKGGHFVAWEEPQLFSTEIRTAFRPLR
ncbi:epoxide hydrolase [Pseudonocardia yunnanensis]